MAHIASKSSYESLVDRLNLLPQGAPPSDTLFAILKLLFSEREAGLVAQLPIKPFTAAVAARRWQLDEIQALSTLEGLAGRAILLDIVAHDGTRTFVLPPPMAGFFEFSMMHLRGDIDQQILGELFYQYMNVEEDFIKSLFIDGETQLGRVFVQERTLPPVEWFDQKKLQILDYERASEIIHQASCRAIGICYCRQKMMQVDRACSAPLEICMTFNNTAASLVRSGFARPVDIVEGKDLLILAQEHGLVQFGENVRRSINFICNCCGCCCEALIAARRFSTMHPIHTTNYQPHILEESCNGCAKCVSACPVEAMTLVSANHPQQAKLKKAKHDANMCLGCGVCVRACRFGAIQLERRSKLVITPVDTAYRTVLMAIEREKLPYLIFDNQALASHRLMAAILGAILRLPPLKKALANQQLKSVYLEKLFEWGEKKSAQATLPPG